ncbi:MAG: TAXI family TRAP transporter solute-binding subunit [Ruminococcaceae bacterium]|nr:TAXI family TRAP transporter solute-binding subunit [Oscillospiraceae bacterium]
MKKFLAVLLAALMLFTLAACGGNNATDGNASDGNASAGNASALKAVTMGTGGPQGTYYAYGGVLGTQIKNSTGVNVTVVSTDGSKDNILRIKSGNIQLGTVQSDVLAYAYSGTNIFAEEGKVDTFRVIAGLYAEAVQLITMDPEIKSVADLAGKRVSIGAPNSGVYFNAVDILGAAGLTEADIQPQYLSFDASVDSLTDGKIDAAFIVAGAPTPAVEQLTAVADAYLVPIDGDIADKLMANSSYYTVYEIPAGTYKGQEEAVKTVTVKATLIVSADLAEEDVYNITKAIFDNADTIPHAKAAELSLENATSGMAAPFHTGAAKYFAEKGITVESK